MGMIPTRSNRLLKAACAVASALFALLPAIGATQTTTTPSPIEYRLYGEPIYTLEKKLNALAGEGWRLHSTMPVLPGRPCKFENGQDAKDCVFMILERRKTKSTTP